MHSNRRKSKSQDKLLAVVPVETDSWASEKCSEFPFFAVLSVVAGGRLCRPKDAASGRVGKEEEVVQVYFYFSRQLFCRLQSNSA